jgi:exopolysaccharide production protein ExoQ
MRKTLACNRQAQEQQRAGMVSGIAAAVSFVALAFIPRYGTLAALLFLAPWTYVILLNPTRFLTGVARNALILLLPLFSILSMFWSNYPFDTLKHGVEFLLTILVAICAGTCIWPRIFLFALFCSSLFIAICNVTIGVHGVDQTSGEYVFLGIFPSKNILALYSAILMIVSLALLFERDQRPLYRFIFGAGLLAGTVSLIQANSAGTTVFAVLSVAVTLFLRLLHRLPSEVRILVLIAIVLFSLGGAAAISLVVTDKAVVLDALGKDASLTGRTELWDSAWKLIDISPLLGVGYEGFWQVGNPEAERLWFISNVPSGAGFNFHNLYLNVWVELGLIGLAIVVLTFASRLVMLSLLVVTTVKDHEWFAINIFLYLLFLSSVEGYLLYEFNIAAVLLFMSACYLNPRSWRTP